MFFRSLQTKRLGGGGENPTKLELGDGSDDKVTLPHKHKDLSSDPQDLQSLAWWFVLVVRELGRQRQANPCDSLASHFSLRRGQ